MSDTLISFICAMTVIVGGSVYLGYLLTRNHYETRFRTFLNADNQLIRHLQHTINDLRKQLASLKFDRDKKTGRFCRKA